MENLTENRNANIKMVLFLILKKKLISWRYY